MRPLLISTYELGHQPLMLAVAQGALLDAGVDVDVLDAHLAAPTADQLRAAPLIAIAVPMHTALRLGLEIVRAARTVGSSARIVMFGLYAPLNAEHLFAAGVDVVLGPEFSEPLVAVARGGNLAGVPGIWLPGVTPELRPSRPGSMRVERRGLAQLESYAHLVQGTTSHKVGYVEATRGCKHTCRHCPITPVYQGRFFALDRDAVLADVDLLVAAGAEHITFGDPDFLNGPAHSLRLVERLHARHPSVTWDATIKVEHILQQPEVFARFKELGCLFVVSAVESFSDHVLTALDKGHTGEDARRAINILRKAGITLRPTFVAFSPWGSAADYLHMLDVIDDEGIHDAVDPVQLAIRLLIPPHSALLETCAHEPWLGPLNPTTLSHVWNHPDPRMDALAHELTDAVGHAAQQDPLVTLAQVMALARSRLGSTRPPALPDMKERAPRLDESWFC